MNTITLASGLTLIHGDCMEYLATLPDGAFDLAVVDPEYGINAARQSFGFSVRSRMEKKGWDKNPPDKKYFDELFRASENQIVWGGNYFPLPPSRCFVVWDKGPSFRNRDFAECEQAWVSIDGNARIINYDPLANGDYKNRIHHTQKPVALYRWLLQNYAKPGQTVLDTHLGSGSSAIAAWEMGYTFTGIEIDKDYFNAAVERISKRLLSPYLPGIAGNEGKGQAEQVKLFCD